MRLVLTKSKPGGWLASPVQTVSPHWITCDLTHLLSMPNPEKHLIVMGEVLLSQLRKFVWTVWKGLIFISCAVSVKWTSAFSALTVTLSVLQVSTSDIWKVSACNCPIPCWMKKFCVYRPEVNCLDYVSLIRWLFGQGFLLPAEITLQCFTWRCWKKKIGNYENRHFVVP